MFGLFKKKSLLSEENLLFQIETYRWLLTHFGGDDFYKETQLILPNEEFFPHRLGSPEAAAQTTFDQVKRYACMQEWPVKLVAQEHDPEIRVAATVVVNTEQNPLGTFSMGDANEATVSYNPKIVTNPSQMVATFAHELSHYLTGTAPEPPPGGWENWEFATDICATFLGFGIFQANSAFNFRQYTDVGSQGWQVTGGGYLSEAEHSYALAIFLRLKEIPPEIALLHCNRNIRNYLKQALNELDKTTTVSKLKSIEYKPNSLAPQ